MKQSVDRHGNANKISIDNEKTDKRKIRDVERIDNMNIGKKG